MTDALASAFPSAERLLNESQHGAARRTDPQYAPPGTAEAPAIIKATPYRWPDPETIPPRRFLFGRHAIRGFVSLTVAGGGTGKTALAMTEALALASGRDLLKDGVLTGAAVWYIGLEDPIDEYERRLAAAALHYGLAKADLQCSLFLDSGRNQNFVMAHEERGALKIVEPVVAAVIRNVLAHEIGLVVVDPFIGCHTVSESDNTKIEKVARLWGRVAEETGCAVELIHHVRKGGAGQEASADDARGASALVNAARSVRILGVMTKEEADQAGVEDRRAYVRVTCGKSNLSPMSDRATWRRLTSVPLGNGIPGDVIGVASPWKFPEATEGMSVNDLLRVQKAVAEGEWRESSQADKWVGIPVASALGLDIVEAKSKGRVKALLKIWINSGSLKIVERPDEKRMLRKCVEVGAWAV